VSQDAGCLAKDGYAALGSQQETGKKSLDKFPQITANGTSGGVPDEKRIRTDFPKPFNNRITPR
jgi:hypothetical protein